MLAWCLEAFAASSLVADAVIAAPPGHELELADLAPPGLSVEVVAGGDSRSQSVAAALDAVSGDASIAVVHDAARPLVSAALIDRVIARLAANPGTAGVIAATPLTDTVKRAAGSGEETPAVAETLDRGTLWAAQTPQAFRAAALREALSSAAARLAAASDDASLVEAAGGEVVIEPAPPSNLKVTTRTDLLLAGLLLGDG